MRSQLINRTAEMQIYISVVDEGGFSAAARRSGMTPSAISKLVGRLERRLGTRLLNRSTRALQLTPEGVSFYERSRRIMADIEEAEHSASAGETPSGPIRLSTSASYATHVLFQIVPEFVQRFPAVELEIVQTDLVVDLLSDRADVAIRAGPLKNSSLVARKLGATEMTLVASTSYLERHGRPAILPDLAHHHRLGFNYTRSVDGWPMLQGDSTIIVPTSPNIRASDGEALRQLALAGAGIARLTNFTVRRDLAEGRLVALLEDYNPGDCELFHVVFLGQGGPLPARVRAILDFLAERGRVS